MLGEADRMPLDAFEQSAREHDVVAGNRWQGMKLDQRLLTGTNAPRSQRDDMTTIDVQFMGQAF